MIQRPVETHPAQTASNNENEADTSNNATQESSISFASYPLQHRDFKQPQEAACKPAKKRNLCRFQPPLLIVHRMQYSPLQKCAPVHYKENFRRSIICEMCTRLNIYYRCIAKTSILFQVLFFYMLPIMFVMLFFFMESCVLTLLFLITHY